MKKFIILVITMLVLSACNINDNSNTNNTEKKALDIIVSSYPLEYIVTRLGEDALNVKSILPPGADAHSYEPTAKEIVEVAKNDLFIYTGELMEPYADSIADSLKSEDVLLVSLDHAEAVFQQVDSSNLEGDNHQHESNAHEEEIDAHHHEHKEEAHELDSHDGHSHGDVDPHFWLDPNRMVTASEHIKTELSHHFPEYASLFSANFKSLKADLENLNDEFKQMVDRHEKRTIFVSHAAFGYWEEEYGMEQLSIRGLSTSNEPSQKELAVLVEQVQHSNIPYVILEQNQQDQLASLLAKELDLETLYIHNLSVLSDEEIKSGEDYLSIMRKNIQTIDQALGRR